MANEQIRVWALPDEIMRQVYLHLSRVLPNDPEHNLIRGTTPFVGMMTYLTRRDPYTLGREHEFAFQVKFHADEETLVIERGSYYREDSP